MNQVDLDLLRPYKRVLDPSFRCVARTYLGASSRARSEECQLVGGCPLDGSEETSRNLEKVLLRRYEEEDASDDSR